MTSYLQYDSMFDPSLKIDIPNYLTELVLVNFLHWQKKPLPRSPFWRKDIWSGDAWLKQLNTRYIAELSAMKDLLEVFAPPVIADYLKESKSVGFRMVKAETKQKMLMELFNRQVKFIRGLENIEKRAVELASDKRPFMGTLNFVPKKNIMGGL